MAPSAVRIEVLDGFWADLSSHVERNALFIVSPDLDLKEVAELVALDDKKMISEWIDEEKITRPDVEQVRAWNQTPDKSFKFAIVQPYVFIQEKAH